jgi:hypothetical protein
MQVPAPSWPGSKSPAPPKVSLVLMDGDRLAEPPTSQGTAWATAFSACPDESRVAIPGGRAGRRAGRCPTRRASPVATKTLRRQYRSIRPEDARVLLFDGGSAPLAAFGPKLSAMAARDLSKLGVELHMGSIVTAADPQSLQMFDKPFRYHDLVTPPTYPAGEPSSLRSS